MIWHDKINIETKWKAVDFANELEMKQTITYLQSIPCTCVPQIFIMLISILLLLISLFANMLLASCLGFYYTSKIFPHMFV